MEVVQFNPRVTVQGVTPGGGMPSVIVTRHRAVLPHQQDLAGEPFPR
jgi:hypothetical protein